MIRFLLPSLSCCSRAPSRRRKRLTIRVRRLRLSSGRVRNGIRYVFELLANHIGKAHCGYPAVVMQNMRPRAASSRQILFMEWRSPMA